MNVDKMLTSLIRRRYPIEDFPQFYTDGEPDTRKFAMRKKASFWQGFEKRAFGSGMAIDPGLAGATSGLLVGHSAGRSAAGTAANMLSRQGTKTKNEELARNVAHATGILGALGGMALGYKHKKKIMDVVRNRLTKEPVLQQLAEGVLPFAAGTAGGALAGGATGALASLRRGVKKKDE